MIPTPGIQCCPKRQHRAKLGQMAGEGEDPEADIVANR